MPRHTNRSILLSGAASGIGRASALQLASEGASLYLTDVATEGLSATVKEASELGDGEVLSRVTNVASESDVTTAVADCAERFGRIDALCNIAGILKFEHTHETSLDTWRQIMSVNLDGLFLMTREALPHLVESKGVICNMGSTAGLMGLAYGAAYGASKGAVHAFTRAVAVEYATRGVRANSICPASIDTGMMGNSFPDGAEMKMLMRPSSLHGNRPPEVVADLVAFLCSDDARHITGEEIRIDGAALA